MFGYNFRKVLTNGRFKQGRLAKTAMLACFLTNELIATKTQSLEQEYSRPMDPVYSFQLAGFADVSERSEAVVQIGDLRRSLYKHA